MRVIATKDFATYYRHVSVRVKKGEELDGLFARFLVDGRAPVAIFDDDAPEPGGDAEGTGEQQLDENLDIGGTAAQILEWVGADPARARDAHDAEAAKDKPRTTLMAKLADLAGS